MACEVLRYQDFTKKLVANLGGRSVPMGVTIGLTDRCNLRCVHCYVHDPDPSQDRLLRSRELGTEQWFEIFDQLAEAGCMWMLMTGGEILLRSDFVDLYRHAKQKGFLVTLFTNGTLLTADLVDFLQDWYPFEIEVSLYGLTPETYEKVAGSASAYERAMRGVRLLVEAKMPVRLKSMAMTLTKDELPAMYDLANELGVPFYHDGMIWQTFYGKDISDLRLSPEDVVAFDSLHPNAAEDFLRAYDRHNEIAETSSSYDPAQLYGCGAGHRSFYVDPYGHLGLCQAVRPTLYDLTTGTFREGWEVLGEYRSKARANKDYPCMHCSVVGLCRRCSARSIQEHGEAETVVQHACAVAHLRAQHLGLAIQSEGSDQELSKP